MRSRRRARALGMCAALLALACAPTADAQDADDPSAPSLTAPDPAAGAGSLEIGDGGELPGGRAPDAALPEQESQTPDALPILVVDMQQVRRDSTVVTDVQRQIEQRRDAYESRLRETERELQQDQQSLLERRAEMSGEDYAEAVRALEERLTRAQREMRNTKASLDRLYNRGMLEVDRAIVSIAEDIAVERGAQMVLPKAAVLLVRNELEVTETVVQRLNRRLPALDLDSLTPRP